jgi:long-chain acyl-CoA synthetase
MAGYRIPRSVDFATEFPKTPTGKIKKKILRDAYWKDVDRKI